MPRPVAALHTSKLLTPGRIFLRKPLLRLRGGAPKRSTRDPAKPGSGSGGDAAHARGPCISLRGRIFLRKTLLRPSRWRPEAKPRDPAKLGSGSGGDAWLRTRGRIFLRKALLRPSRSRFRWFLLETSQNASCLAPQKLYTPPRPAAGCRMTAPVL